MADLNYPIDNREAYQSRINFTVLEAKPLKDTVEDIMAGQVPASEFAGLSPEDAAIEATAIEDNYKQRQIDKAIQVGPVYRTLRNEKHPTVALFTPLSMTFNDAVSYDGTFELGLLGTNVTGGIAKGQSVASSVAQGVTDTATSFTEVLKRGIMAASDEGKVAAVRLAKAAPQAVRGALQLSTQATTNPNLRAIFNRVAIRQFTFQFKMIPTSRQESVEIEKIVKHFRKEMLPEVIAQNAGYRFPNGFRIRILHKDADVKMQKVPDCFLERCDTVYNASSGVFHKEGFPSEVDVTLGFVEMMPISKADVESGF